MKDTGTVSAWDLTAARWLQLAARSNALLATPETAEDRARHTIDALLVDAGWSNPLHTARQREYGKDFF